MRGGKKSGAVFMIQNQAERMKARRAVKIAPLFFAVMANKFLILFPKET